MNKKRLFCLGLLGSFSSGWNGWAASLHSPLRQGFSVEKFEAAYNEGAPYAGGWIRYVAHGSLEGGAWSLGGFLSGPSQMDRSKFGAGALLSLQLGAVEACLKPRICYQLWGENWKAHVDADCLLRVKGIRGLETTQLMMRPAAGLGGSPRFGIHPMVPLKRWIGLPVNCSFLVTSAFGAPKDFLSFRLDLDWNSGKTSNLFRNLYNNYKHLGKIASNFYDEVIVKSNVEDDGLIPDEEVPSFGKLEEDFKENKEDQRILEEIRSGGAQLILGSDLLRAMLGDMELEQFVRESMRPDKDGQVYMDEPRLTLALCKKVQELFYPDSRVKFLFPAIKKAVDIDPEKDHPRVYTHYEEGNEDLEGIEEPILDITPGQGIELVKELEAFRDELIRESQTSANYDPSRYVAFELGCRGQPKPTLTFPKKFYGNRADIPWARKEIARELGRFLDKWSELEGELEPTPPSVDFYHEYQNGGYCQTVSINNYLGMHLLTPGMGDYLIGEAGVDFPHTPEFGLHGRALHARKALVESLGVAFENKRNQSPLQEDTPCRKVLRLLDLESWGFCREDCDPTALVEFLKLLEENNANRLLLSVDIRTQTSAHMVAMRKTNKAGRWVLLDGNGTPIELHLENFLNALYGEDCSIQIEIPSEISRKIEENADSSWYNEQYKVNREALFSPDHIFDRNYWKEIQRPLRLRYYLDAITYLSDSHCFEKRPTLIYALKVLPVILREIVGEKTEIDKKLKALLDTGALKDDWLFKVTKEMFYGGSSRSESSKSEIKKELVGSLLIFIDAKIRTSIEKQVSLIIQVYLDSKAFIVRCLEEIAFLSTHTVVSFASDRRVEAHYLRVLKGVGNLENRYREEIDYEDFESAGRELETEHNYCVKKATEVLGNMGLQKGPRGKNRAWLGVLEAWITAKACMLNYLNFLEEINFKAIKGEDLPKGCGKMHFRRYGVAILLNRLSLTDYVELIQPEGENKEEIERNRGELKSGRKELQTNFIEILMGCDSLFMNEMSQKLDPAPNPASIRSPYRLYEFSDLAVVDGRPHGRYSQSRYSV